MAVCRLLGGEARIERNWKIKWSEGALTRDGRMSYNSRKGRQAAGGKLEDGNHSSMRGRKDFVRKMIGRERKQGKKEKGGKDEGRRERKRKWKAQQLSNLCLPQVILLVWISLKQQAIFKAVCVSIPRRDRSVFIPCMFPVFQTPLEQYKGSGDPDKLFTWIPEGGKARMLDTTENKRCWIEPEIL